MLPHHWTVSFLKPRVISFHLVYSAPPGILSTAKYTQHSRYSIYVYSSANKIHSCNSFFFFSAFWQNIYRYFIETNPKTKASSLAFLVFVVAMWIKNENHLTPNIWMCLVCFECQRPCLDTLLGNSTFTLLLRVSLPTFPAVPLPSWPPCLCTALLSCSPQSKLSKRNRSDPRTASLRFLMAPSEKKN